MDIIDQFIDEKLAETKEWSKEVEKWRKKFVKDFPIDSIQKISLTGYLASPKGTGNRNSFCNRIENELRGISSMGNSYPDKYGIYYMGGINLSLSKTFSNQFDDNYDAAFEYIKSLIVNLLTRVGDGDLSYAETCELNSLFINKLLSIYYPEYFVPVCAKKTLQGYCDAIGLRFEGNIYDIYKNRALVEWKESVPEISDWSNHVLMAFLDQLWRKNTIIDGKRYRKDDYSKQLIEYVEEYEETEAVGETREAMIKIRVNQSLFRDKLNKRYERCCLCGVSNQDFLIASHIKPWCDCEPVEKVDVNNGLLLCPNHDKVFDRGYISFDDDGLILISDKVAESDRVFLNIRDGMHFDIREGNIKYIQYHRNHIFQGR